MARTKVEGLERLKARIASLPKAAKEETKAANLRAAQGFFGAARRDIGRGNPDRGHLQSTVIIREGDTETGVLVTVGGPSNPYPLHLEVGHKAADGSHVPPKPFWYANRRAAVKKHKAAMKRVLSKVVNVT